MYYIKKTMSISASHSLKLDYDSKCKNMHGHNWKITVYCKASKLDKNGMIIDFSVIKEVVNQLDHDNLNATTYFYNTNPTAENIAKWILYQINTFIDIHICYRVIVQETEGNEATYEENI